MPDAPVARTARFDVLLAGSPGPNVASTCTLVRDGSVVAVVDPGLAPSQEAIVGPLRALGLDASDVTDVVISHHHPDHCLNVALFPRARVHDHWAIYDFAGRWDDVECEGRELSSLERWLAKRPTRIPYVRRAGSKADRPCLGPPGGSALCDKHRRVRSDGYVDGRCIEHAAQAQLAWHVGRSRSSGSPKVA